MSGQDRKKPVKEARRKRKGRAQELKGERESSLVDDDWDDSLLPLRWSGAAGANASP
jgi:hypothetical protein